MNGYRHNHPIFEMMDFLLRIKIIPLESRARFLRTAITLLVEGDQTEWWINKKAMP